ncbi:hypothetical protein KL86PLE_100305 [uncultured Pleomorphomonas sp.]|uniref:Uncharacterized protein n=1 Tax=uncultured Pleomorphomonas sp. TaxID=442121 RepID=A0A212L2C5_9HYPH|nr:hypothetical protein [uncultured Pleomorphomonas sp.]SCM71678.1 hypothetical protein KL86PLE_100305 [uncultured Pleomorphomonas sp.]
MAEKTAHCDIHAERYEGDPEVAVYFRFDSEAAADDFLMIFSKAIEAGEITIGSIQFPPARLAKPEN